MAAYTDAATVAKAMGVTFTADQSALADQVAAAASNVIDRYTGRTWQTASPRAGELALVVVPEHDLVWGATARVFLRQLPVLAVSRVALRLLLANDEGSVLDPSAYELVDPANGVLLLPGYTAWAAPWYAPWYTSADVRAVVDYTYTDAVPVDIALAATMITAAQMARVLAAQGSSGLAATHPELAGLASLAVGQNDVAVTLADPSGSSAASAIAAGSAWITPGSAVASILDTYRRVVIA